MLEFLVVFFLSDPMLRKEAFRPLTPLLLFSFPLPLTSELLRPLVAVLVLVLPFAGARSPPSSERAPVPSLEGLAAVERDLRRSLCMVSRLAACLRDEV